MTETKIYRVKDNSREKSKKIKEITPNKIPIIDVSINIEKAERSFFFDIFTS